MAEELHRQRRAALAAELEELHRQELEELKSFAELQQELKTQQSSIWKCCLKFPQLCHSKERESIEKQYRGLSVKFHPDKGGEEDDMKVLNACRDKLLEHSGA